MWLPDGEKKFYDMFSHFDRILACDRQTDGQTDILQRHSPRYASHRAVKMNACTAHTLVRCYKKFNSRGETARVYLKLLKVKSLCYFIIIFYSYIGVFMFLRLLTIILSLNIMLHCVICVCRIIIKIMDGWMDNSS